MEQAVGTGLGTLSALLIMAVVGLLIGAVAKLLTPGPDPGGWLATILLGIAGSWVGGFLAGRLGIAQGLVSGLVFAVVGAMLLLLAYRLIRRAA
jgi:uncharacterized membrane protein YeaQ/YmgE (transglycosylase-associated protein family)